MARSTGGWTCARPAPRRPNAWSPDGTLLATGQQPWGCRQLTGGWDEDQWLRCLEQTDVTFFVDASGRGAPVPPPLKAGVVGSHGLLGWTGPDEVLVLDDVVDPDESRADSELHWLTAVPLDGSEPYRLSAVSGAGATGSATSSCGLPCCRTCRCENPARPIGDVGQQ